MPHTILSTVHNTSLPLSENIMTIASALMWVEVGEIDMIREILRGLLLGNVSHGAPVFLFVCRVSVLDLLMNEARGFLSSLYLMWSTKPGI